MPQDTPRQDVVRRPRSVKKSKDNSFAAETKRARFKIARSDLWAIIINGVFGLLGLVLLPSNPDVGIVTIAFFGSGGLFLAWLQWQRYSDHALQLTEVAVVGGVRILPRRGFMLAMGAWLIVLGLVFIVFGRSYPELLRWLGGFILLCGAVLFVLAALRLHPAGFLQFEPEGLIIGQRGWHMLVPWDAIHAVEIDELANNPIIRLGVFSDLAVITPTSAEAKARKAMLGGSWWSWSPFIIMPMHYGISTAVLAATIRRCVHDTAARKSLSDRRLTGPAAS